MIFDSSMYQAYRKIGYSRSVSFVESLHPLVPAAIVTLALVLLCIGAVS